MMALTPEQCIYAMEALHELNPKGWVIWDDFWRMVNAASFRLSGSHGELVTISHAVYLVNFSRRPVAS